MEDEHSRSSSNNTKPTASKSEVISSAKVIMDAAKSAFSNDNEKIDKAQVAGAVADVLQAANHCGKLEDKSYGNIINKAEDYLHKYNATNGHGGGGGGGGVHGHGGHSSGGGNNDGGHGHSNSGGGGYGEYVKFAQGILKK